MKTVSSESSETSAKMPVIAIIGWLICLLGLTYATLVGNGAEFPRIVYALPFLVLGSLLVYLRTAPNMKSSLLLLVFLAGGYFLVRAACSPVWDLARRDVVLVTSAVSALVAGSCAFQFRLGRGLFLGVLVCLLLAHGLVAAYQELVDPSFAVMEASRADQQGVSGFYFHRNYLAGFLEILTPVFVALAARGSRGWLMWALVAFGAAGLCFFTNSRGGFTVTVLGTLCTFLVMRFSIANAAGKKIRPLSVIVALGFVSAIFVVGWFSFEVIASKREGIEGAAIGRLSLAGIAFDTWIEAPLFGQGAYAYSYLFPKNFSGLGGWYGDAKMVHSDYLQVLAEYGAVGLVIVFILVVTFLGWAFLCCRAYQENTQAWLPFAAVGVIVAELVRAAFDFNLHMVPNLILFAFLIGGMSSSVPLVAARPTAASTPSIRAGIFVVLLLFGGFGIYSVQREIVAAPSWLKVERAKFKGDDVLPALREYALAAPSYHVLRDAGHILIERGDLQSLRQGKEIWRTAVQLHRYDGEGLANYAYCLDQFGEFSQAEEYHLRAVKAVSRRENKYGVVYGVGWHLVRRAEEASQARRSGEALFLYQAARDAFAESYRRNYSRTMLNREMQQWLAGRIKFLEGARIEPVEVEILDWRSKLP